MSFTSWTAYVKTRKQQQQQQQQQRQQQQHRLTVGTAEDQETFLLLLESGHLVGVDQVHVLDASDGDALVLGAAFDGLHCVGDLGSLSLKNGSAEFYALKSCELLHEKKTNRCNGGSFSIAKRFILANFVRKVC